MQGKYCVNRGPLLRNHKQPMWWVRASNIKTAPFPSQHSDFKPQALFCIFYACYLHMKKRYFFKLSVQPMHVALRSSPSEPNAKRQIQRHFKHRLYVCYRRVWNPNPPFPESEVIRRQVSVSPSNYRH